MAALTHWQRAGDALELDLDSPRIPAPVRAILSAIDWTSPLPLHAPYDETAMVLMPYLLRCPRKVLVFTRTRKQAHAAHAALVGTPKYPTGCETPPHHRSCYPETFRPGWEPEWCDNVMDRLGLVTSPRTVPAGGLRRGDWPDLEIHRIYVHNVTDVEHYIWRLPDQPSLVIVLPGFARTARASMFVYFRCPVVLLQAP